MLNLLGGAGNDSTPNVTQASLVVALPTAPQVASLVKARLQMNNEIENKIELAVSTAKKVQTETNTMIANERMSRLELEKTIRDNEEAQQHFIRYVSNEFYLLKKANRRLEWQCFALLLIDLIVLVVFGAWLCVIR